ncbi:virulence factor [Methylosinus sp. Sm6]|uniref:virulence factor n=1 Tax=Methylosinus sp. Sm6 TaxID=2866948 RepID=UPI00351D7568
MRASSSRKPTIGHNRPGRSNYMYAIAFDLDTEQLRQLYPNANWNNACFDIRRELEESGFRWRQGSVYFGNDDIRATDCVKATMDLDALFPWFKPSVRDIRMLQITEEDTLMDFLGYEAGRSARDRKR